MVAAGTESDVPWLSLSACARLPGTNDPSPEAPNNGAAMSSEWSNQERLIDWTEDGDLRPHCLTAQKNCVS